MHKIRLIIAGSRSFQDWNLLDKYADEIIGLETDVEIISGLAYGADQGGRVYAIKRKLPFKGFPADWKLGKKAGPMRNKQMAEYGTHLLAFWDGESRGTMTMIELAKKNNLILKVVMCPTSTTL